jgi:hypothetical protein
MSRKSKLAKLNKQHREHKKKDNRKKKDRKKKDRREKNDKKRDKKEKANKEPANEKHDESSQARPTPIKPAQSISSEHSLFSQHDKVMYRTSSGAEVAAQIAAVHHDDVEVYYTIKLHKDNGTASERQTIGRRLRAVGSTPDRKQKREECGDGPLKRQRILGPPTHLQAASMPIAVDNKSTRCESTSSAAPIVDPMAGFMAMQMLHDRKEYSKDQLRRADGRNQ